MVKKKRSINAYKKIFALLVFGILFGCLFVSAANYSMSSEGIEYDEGIEGKFLYRNKVFVSIALKDKAEPVFNETTGIIEYEKLLVQWRSERAHEIINGLGKNKFAVYLFSNTEFYGSINKEAFEELKKMEEVKLIKLPDDVGWLSFTMNILHLKWYIWLVFILILYMIILFFIKLNRRKKNVKKK